ncbi:hypothetical protein [uncultured Nostoc sp.]|uniref:hypothetical protein n=1 Tax=uncultured Nostoc sp. TaxID=340711 RepID=UPI0035CC4577
MNITFEILFKMYNFFGVNLLQKIYGDHTHNKLSSLYYWLINLFVTDLKRSVFAQIFGDKNKTPRLEIQEWQAQLPEIKIFKDYNNCCHYSGSSNSWKYRIGTGYAAASNFAQKRIGSGAWQSWRLRKRQSSCNQVRKGSFLGYAGWERRTDLLC